MVQKRGADAAWIRRRREQTNMTQEDLARRAGVTAKTVYRYESGDAAGGRSEDLIRWALLLARADHLAVDVEQLADTMEVTVGQAKRVLGETPVSKILLERAHRALDLIERRMSVEDYREERPA